MQVLGFETSCDETAVALYNSDTGQFKHILYSQIPTHAPFGGVVPELASRDHLKKCLPLLQELCQQTGVGIHEIDGIAYTRGPGLLGAVLVGATFARSLAFALNIPSIGVHHLEGHLLAPMLVEPRPSFPHLALLVSGGHTQLIAVKGLGQYTLIGDTLDDAAGEAFDKTAKSLGLPYPGGAALAALAATGRRDAFAFAQPMTKRPGCDFSFSGLKTAVVQLIAKLPKPLDETTRADIAASFEYALVSTILIKCARALKATGLSTLVVSGGVSANRYLREQLDAFAGTHGIQVFYPPLDLCTDNAAMIAYVGACRMLGGERDGDDTRPRARWPLVELAPPVVA